jgi:hypothetical protein
MTLDIISGGILESILLLLTIMIWRVLEIDELQSQSFSSYIVNVMMSLLEITMVIIEAIRHFQALTR